MRDRQRTIESLRRLAERPGTIEEGIAARELLKKFGGSEWIITSFDAHLFAPGDVVFYCYWCYRNDRGVVRKSPPRFEHGQWWMHIKFDRLKQPRWVPVTSELGCHLSHEPFTGNVKETLYRGDIDWALKDEEFRRECAALGISLRVWNQPVQMLKDIERMP